jgi:outer membrane protein TolC
MIRLRRFAASARQAHTTFRRSICWASLLVLLVETAALAQQPTGTPIRLAELQQAAIESDPRMKELALLEQQSALRLQNVGAQWKPSLSIESLAQYQSDAPSTPLLTPLGKPVFAAPKDNYDLYGRVEQRLFDTSVKAQTAVERAQLLEQQARVRAAVYAIRQQVNDAFFAAAMLQQRANVVAATVTELEGRLRESNARVREGTALPADAAAIEATLLQRQQDADELRANVRAALARLSTITGRPVAPDSIPVIPDLSSQAADAARLQNLRTRPEYEQFARSRDRIGRQADVVTAAAQPKVSAFARVGYGRPALDFVQNEWQPYGVGGVRLQWNAWNWGSTGREREAQSLQQQIVAADEAAFTRSIATATEGDLATVDHLTRALATDQRIIDLRAEVERAARVRLQEGVLTSSDYLARDSELLQARIAQATHQVELAQAQARLLTTVGVEVR